MSRRLGVVGSLVLDTIRRPGEAEPRRELGGIAYSLVAFEAGPAPGWTTLPVVKVGDGATEPARRLLDRLRTVGSTEGVRTVPAPNNRVELVYRSDGGRAERLSGGVPGWSWTELAPLAEKCDAMYVNLIAGWEVDLACARSLGESFRGPVYCDLHSLLLGLGPDGARFPRVPEGWERWFRCFDYVQLNEDELELLAGAAGRPSFSLAEELVREGPRALFVTLGPRGAAWVTDGGGRTGGTRGGPEPRDGGTRTVPERGSVPAGRAVEGGDPTGCGDVWGMACFSALLAGAGVRGAVAGANRLASRNADATGAEGLLEAVRSAGDPTGGTGRGGGSGAGGSGGARPPGGL